MTSPVEVVNIALAEIGIQHSISSFNDTSTEAKVAKLLYQPKIDALFRAARWNCARKQGNLTLLKAVSIDGVTSTDPPPRPWYYEYLYPADCLAARYLIPDYNVAGDINPPLTTAEVLSSYMWGIGSVPYAVANDTVSTKPTRVILTNLQNAILVYTFRVDDPTQWDPQFLAAATSFLGSWFVNALGRNRTLAGDEGAIARDMIAQARISDGNEGSTTADHSPDWLRIRGINAGFVTDTRYLNGWDPLAFPGGSVF